FQWLTGKKPDPAAVQRGGQVGEAKVPDERLDWLSAHFKPKSTKAAEMGVVGTPGLRTSERRDNPRPLGMLRGTQRVVIVMNSYSKDDLAGELRRFREELLFADLEVVTNRIGRLEDSLKKPRQAKQKEADQAELALLHRIAATFEQGQTAAAVGLKPDEEK